MRGSPTAFGWIRWSGDIPSLRVSTVRTPAGQEQGREGREGGRGLGRDAYAAYGRAPPAMGLRATSFCCCQSICNRWICGGRLPAARRGGAPQGLALIFIPAGGGGGGSPLDPLPPSPPPSAQVHLKTWGLGTFFSHGKKIFSAFGACHLLCTCCSTCAPYTLSCRPPCPNADCECISAPRSNRRHAQNAKT